jgi:shikimate kinase
MNIVLFGIKSSGKTTFGKKLAEKLGKAFIDTDRLIEETYQVTRKKKLTISQIYQEVGPITFRALEYEVIQSLQDVQNSIIAVGGGVMLLYENVEALKKNSHLIYLVFDREALKKRVLASHPLPSFLNPNDPESSFDKMYDERDHEYQKINAIQINVTHMKDQDVISKICESIKDGE